MRQNARLSSSPVLCPMSPVPLFSFFGSFGYRKNRFHCGTSTDHSANLVRQFLHRYILPVDVIEHRSFFTMGNWNASTRLTMAGYSREIARSSEKGCPLAKVIAPIWLESRAKKAYIASCPWPRYPAVS